LATWDVFHSDRLEVERGLDDTALRAGLASGMVSEDDLVRPAGSGAPWERLGDRLDLLAAPAEPPAIAEPEPEPELPTMADPGIPPRPIQTNPLVATEWDTEIFRRAEGLAEVPADDDNDYEKVDPELSEPALFSFVDGEEGLDLVDDEAPAPPAAGTSATAGPILPPYERSVAIPVPGPAPLPFDEEELEVEFDGEDEYDPLEEDEAVAEFTLARGSAERVEELDLAAMVDVAFQLVLFFLVTATTVLYKSLEVPKPNPEKPPDAAQQSRAKTLDEMMKDEILVEVDAGGSWKIDRQPVPGAMTMTALAERLRKLREDTGRKGMLLSAEYNVPHRLTIVAYDAANEVGMNIKTATPINKAASAVPPPVARKG
jgi:biopolymer transport protein ExbD